MLVLLFVRPYTPPCVSCVCVHFVADLERPGAYHWLAYGRLWSSLLALGGRIDMGVAGVGASVLAVSPAALPRASHEPNVSPIKRLHTRLRSHFLSLSLLRAGIHFCLMLLSLWREHETHKNASAVP